MIFDARSIAEQLHDHRLLGQCTLRERRIIVRHLEVLDLAAGTSVARAGDTATNFFLVLSGDLTAISEHGARRILANDFVGELGLLQRGANSEDLIAQGPCRLGVLGARMFHVLLRDLPPLNQALMADLARRVAFARPEVHSMQ